MSENKKRSVHLILKRCIYGLLTLLGGFIAAMAWSGIPQIPGHRVIPMFVIIGIVAIILLVIILGVTARVINPDK